MAQIVLPRLWHSKGPKGDVEQNALLGIELSLRYDDSQDTAVCGPELPLAISPMALPFQPSQWNHVTPESIYKTPTIPAANVSGHNGNMWLKPEAKTTQPNPQWTNEPNMHSSILGVCLTSISIYYATRPLNLNPWPLDMNKKREEFKTINNNAALMARAKQLN